MRERLEGIQARTDRARAWGAAARPLRPLINRDGYVPVTTRLRADDLDLLAGARVELLCFTELGLRLLDLHQPRDAGGIAGDAAHPILRCRSCMWRWPCPTFRAMSEALAALPAHKPASGSAPPPTGGQPSGPGGATGVSGILGAGGAVPRLRSDRRADRRPERLLDRLPDRPADRRAVNRQGDADAAGRAYPRRDGEARPDQRVFPTGSPSAGS